ncbi:MAG: hypothetical protein ACYSWO_30030 [Planctomycetota bacterium]|jgi:hypothetical protein
MPKHKEVVFWAVGFSLWPKGGEDEVVLLPVTFIETAKQYRIKQEDSRNYREGARLLPRTTVKKGSGWEATLHRTPEAALAAAIKYQRKREDDAKAQMQNAKKRHGQLTDKLLALREADEA